MKLVEGHINVRMGQIDPISVAREVVLSGAQEDSFYILNMDEVISRYYHWTKLMPRVEPFYAVKCNPDKLLLRTLAAMGAGFDCASKAEIELITAEISVQPERIIYANTTKMASHIRHADSLGVDMMTFDSEDELYKIKKLMPSAKLVIRIRCSAARALCDLGDKAGCDPALDAPKLLKLAVTLQLNVVGVSFHIGSGAFEYEAFGRAIEKARTLFDYGARVGLKMSLLDIGGGFLGGSITQLADAAAVINESLATHFPGPEVRVIAEPGRYFASAAFTLVLCVHSKRVIQGDHTMYFVDDGIHGSFNGIVCHNTTFETTALFPSKSAAQPCSIWGPSCDGVDCVIRSARLPPLSVGDWLLFRDMGAYTLSMASTFNGIPVPEVQTVIGRRFWEALKNHHLFSDVHVSGNEVLAVVRPGDFQKPKKSSKISPHRSRQMSFPCN